MDKKLYIAYGSNLNIKQMANRCPTAKVVGASMLKDWRLLFRGAHAGAVATGYYELVAYLIDHKAEYCRFILTGEMQEAD